MPIVLGGAHATALPVETLERFDTIDYCVYGEGEVTFLKLIELIGTNGSVENVKGITWRNILGEIIKNPPRPLIKELDSLPLPAWDILHNFPDGYPHNVLETKRIPATSIIASCSCPMHCTFCDRAVFGSIVRHHSADYTIKMIQYLVEYLGTKKSKI